MDLNLTKESYVFKFSKVRYQVKSKGSLVEDVTLNTLLAIVFLGPIFKLQKGRKQKRNTRKPRVDFIRERDKQKIYTIFKIYMMHEA